MLTVWLFFLLSSFATLWWPVSSDTSGVSATFYFVRHGESEANNAGILQGQCDFPLTDLGTSQARWVGSALAQRNVKWTRVFTSDLTRARETCRLLLAESGVTLPISQTHLLRERRFGVREAMSTALSAEECSKIIAAKLKINVADVVDSAESATELSQRQHLFLHKVFDELCLEDSTSSRSILCVTHSAFIKGLLSSNLGIEMKAISNCSITKMLISRDAAGNLTFSCLPEEVNDAAHMQQEEEPK